MVEPRLSPLAILVLLRLVLSQRSELQRFDSAQARTASREQALAALVPTLAVLETNEEGTITFASDSTEVMLGTHAADLVGHSFHQFTGGTVNLVAASRITNNKLCEWPAPNGTTRELKIAVELLSDNEAGPGYRIALTNVEELVAVENALRESREAFVEMLESAQNGIMVVSADGKILLFNSALARIVGYQHLQLANLNLLQLSPPEKPQSISSIASARIWGAAAPGRYERQLARADGSLCDVELSVSTYPLGYGVKSALIEVIDITERKQAGAEIERLAMFDQLTGLPNRRSFDEAVGASLELSSFDNSSFAVLLIDLDRFKLINDTLGHQIGDTLLQQVAQRFVDALPPGHMVSRFGGDEFVVLTPSLATPDEAHNAANSLVESLTAPFDLSNRQLHSSASVGVALYPHDGIDAPTLLRRADAAMYQAKALGGGGYQQVALASDLESQQRLDIENDLRGAIDRREFAIFYQPEIDIITGDILGFEALLRWNHPERGLLSPADFIPILEDNGLIRLVDEWVLHEACLQSRRWTDAGLPPFVIAVNVSARSFPADGLVHTVREAIEGAGIEPQLLELEVTETAALEDVDVAVGILRDLHQLGVRTALDDFGTGHSSLVRLKAFPLHTLKIDASFVDHMTFNDESAAIVGGVIALGHALGLTVLAEGVEHERQLKLLRSLGCDVAQGYLFAHPLPADEVTTLLAEQRLLTYRFAA